MLIEFNGWYIAADEILEITTKDQNGEARPYILKITKKNGSSITRAYTSPRDSQNAIDRLAAAVNRSESVTRAEVEHLLSQETEKIRRDFRRLRQSINDREVT